MASREHRIRNEKIKREIKPFYFLGLAFNTTCAPASVTLNDDNELLFMSLKFRVRASVWDEIS